MTIENDFLTFAGGSGANVLTQSAYAAQTTLLANGFASGVANSAQLNKVWRQSSIMAAVLAAFIVDQSGQPAIDDGTTATLEANLIAGIRNAAKTQVILTDTGAANAYAAVNSPALTALPTSSGLVQRVSIINANTGASTYAPDGLAAKPIYGLNLSALQGGELVAKGIAVMMYVVATTVNSGNGAWILIECTGGALQVPNATQSQHAVPMGQIQAQSGTAFTAAGTAPAYTLAPSPAIQAYASPQRFNVTFPAAGTPGSNTINVSGLGAIPLKQYAADGSLVSGIVTAGMNSDVQIVGAGSYALLLDPLPSTAIGVRGVRSNLSISYTGTSGVVSVAANELSLESASGAYVTLKNISLSATSGNSSGVANSLDTGSWAFSTFYYLFVIYNPTTQTTALLWSLSATSPTLPSGYTYYALISANKTQSATNYFFLGGTQTDRIFQPKVTASGNVTGLPLVASGAAGSTGTPTWAAINLSGAIPSNAVRIALVGYMGALSSSMIIAPNNAYGAQASTSNPPMITLASAGSSGGLFFPPMWMTLESTSIYWASGQSTNYLYLAAWELNL